MVNVIPKEYHSKVIFQKCKHLLTSGVFAMEWAINQGYTTLYTAGIDMYTENGELYQSHAIHNKIQQVTRDWVKQGIKIYKVEERSILPVEIKFPH